ncbi:MAG: hypothetical protein PHN84_10580 [Desulfuromonadaceae bacterium]|nr:hypothetical protein [Desulfuromonadaceae bacterium]MDD2853991.1 hypothetical protein [Desulfuromonadaceae bacterium]
MKYLQNCIYKWLVVLVFMFTLKPATSNAALVGDFNGDGTVSIAEVQMVINSFLGLTADTYSQNDLTGTWYIFQYITGSNSSWARATLSVSSSGVATPSNGLNSDGGTGQTAAMQLNVSANGEITTTDSTTKMFLSSNKQLIVGTGGLVGDESIYIGIKASSGFQQSDLQGSWRWQDFLQQGNSGSSWANGWQRSNVSINSLGTATVSGGSGSSGSTTVPFTISPFKLDLNSQGIVTTSLLKSFYGVLSTDKNLLVATYTNGDGSIALSMFVRTGVTGFSLANMQGTWNTNFMSLKDFYWGRAVTVFDASGNSIIRNIVQSNGVRADVSKSFTIMSNDGIFGTNASDATFSGVISLDKNLMIGTVTQDAAANPAPSLFIWTK